MRSLPVLLVAWLMMPCAGDRAVAQAHTTEASSSCDDIDAQGVLGRL
jgi:hypothetical protein